MKIESMQIDAHNNAIDKGFHDLEQSVLHKILHMPNQFTREEYKAVANAFMGLGLMLIVSETVEALEALRVDDNENFDEEICDVAIRLGDFSESYGVNLDKGISAKMKKNRERPTMHNGKQF